MFNRLQTIKMIEFGAQMDRFRYPLSVMVWVAVTALERAPIIFSALIGQINTDRYCSCILVVELPSWAREQFDGWCTLDFPTRFSAVSQL